MIFGVYAIALVPGLLLGGPVSDRVGRRSVSLSAACLSLAASVVLVLGAVSTAALFAGRLLAGVSSGIAFSAATSWLKELSSQPFASVPAGTGARRATVAMTCGFGIGPLAAGSLAQWAPHPLAIPYLPHIVLIAALIPLLARVVETRDPRAPKRYSHVALAAFATALDSSASRRRWHRGCSSRGQSAWPSSP